MINSVRSKAQLEYVCMVNEMASYVKKAPAVVVLIDFSDASKEALRWAAHVAIVHKANLLVLYPYRLTQLNTHDDLYMLRKNIEAEARANFNKLAEGVLEKAGPPYDFRPEVGFINDRVYAYTQQKEVLSIVIGNKMAINNREALNEMLEQLRTPLLIVPQAYTKHYF